MRAISLANSGLPLGGMRFSGSSEVMRCTSSLAALLPGTTTLDLSRSARVSIDTEPLYLPLVWHSAQRALSRGTMSCAKSIFAGGCAPLQERGQAVSSARLSATTLLLAERLIAGFSEC